MVRKKVFGGAGVNKMRLLRLTAVLFVGAGIEAYGLDGGEAGKANDASGSKPGSAASPSVEKHYIYSPYSGVPQIDPKVRVRNLPSRLPSPVPSQTPKR